MTKESVKLQKEMMKRVDDTIDSLASHFNDCYILINSQRLRKTLYIIADEYYEKGLKSKKILKQNNDKQRFQRRDDGDLRTW